MTAEILPKGVESFHGTKEKRQQTERQYDIKSNIDYHGLNRYRRGNLNDYRTDISVFYERLAERLI